MIAERRKNNINYGKYLEEYNKGYDIFTLETVDPQKIDNLLEKHNQRFTSWELAKLNSR